MKPFKRLVKLTFQPDKVTDFIAVYQKRNPYINRFKGCQHIELWQSQEVENVLFTLSVWDSKEALEKYRQSDFFRATWAQTKALFTEKAEAWSVDVLDEPKNKIT